MILKEKSLRRSGLRNCKSIISFQNCSFMKEKNFLTSSFITTTVSFVLFFAVTIFQYGCNGENQVKEVDRTWFSIGIKFKPNINSEMRNMTFEAIEDLIRDTVQKIRSGTKYTDFSPKFLIGNLPYIDTLIYEVRAEYMTKDSTIMMEKPPCLCKNACGVCLKIDSNFKRSQTDTSQILTPYRNISAILFLREEYN